MGDVAVQPASLFPANPVQPSTIQIIVVDEKGTKANCKLYRTEKLSEILRKYNSRLHTGYDSIMINNVPVPLTQTPAMLGLEDGQVLKFCKTSPTVSSTSTSTGTNGASQTPRTSTLTSGTGVSSSLLGPIPIEADERTKHLEQRITALESELEMANQRTELLQSQVISLENKVTEEQEKTQCRICFDRYRDTLIFPCLHFSYCFKCLEDLVAQRARECPTCRGHISGTLRMQIV